MEALAEPLTMSVPMRVIERCCRIVPDRVVRRLVHRTSSGLGVALCLHRVGRDDDRPVLFDELSQDPADLDAMIDYFRDCPERLTLSFDDGYADAVDYVADRAERHPDVSFHVFVCPRKTIDRTGHAWDAWMALDGDPVPEVFFDHWRDRLANDDPEIGDSDSLADDPRYRLATPEACREVARRPNVVIGNHTDHHVPLRWLDDDRLASELAHSEARFARHFGTPDQLALPFGCEPFLDEGDVARVLGATSSDVVWTVEPRPYEADEPPTVRPRFGWCNEGLSPKAQAIYIALQCVRKRVRDAVGARLSKSRSVPQLAKPISDRDRAAA